MVKTKVVTLPLGRHANQSNDLSRPVFTDDEIAPGRDCQVVGVMDEVGVVRLDKQFQPSRFARLTRTAFVVTWLVLPNLTNLFAPTAGAGEIELTVSVPDDFSTCELSSSSIEALISQVIFGRFDIFDVDPTHRETLPHRDGVGVGPIPSVETFLVIND